MAIYSAKCFGETYRISADFAQAASPVCVETEDGRWTSTQYQVADFGHRSEDAMRRILEEQVAMSGDDADDYADEIDRAIDRMTEIDD